MVAINLGIFIVVTSLPAFRSVHHHWIFPLLGTALSLEWVLTGKRFAPRTFDHSTARQTVLFVWGVLLLAGVARHATILTCFDRCGSKLGFTALLAGVVFRGQVRHAEAGPWNPARSRAAGFGATVWGGYLIGRAWGLAPWVLEAGLVATAAGVWLSRRGRARLFLAGTILLFLGVRRLGTEGAIVGAGVSFALTLFWLSGRWGGPPSASVAPPAVSWKRRAFRTSLAGLLIIGVFYQALARGKVDPMARRRALLAVTPPLGGRDPGALSPLARRLREHVRVLADEIGERAIYNRNATAAARDYVADQFRKAGLAVSIKTFAPVPPVTVVRGTAFDNVEAILGSPRKGGEGVWVVGAHYDTAPGTPGADDNASGVAVLIEMARLLRAARPPREIRLVAFATEEPPSFGTQNMGSFQYVRRLREAGVSVEGMWALEMLGYYNAREGSQFYPPFLHLLFPDRGTFTAAVANWKSRGLLKKFQWAWRRSSALPLEGAVLPAFLSQAAMSDQLNFWAEGIPALMISDTAFYRNPHYHESSDRPDTLDYERMARITRALADVLKNLPVER